MYDFDKFLEEIKDLDWHTIIPLAETKCISLERGSYGVKGAVKRRELGSTELVEKIKGLLFWLQNGMKPAGLSETDFQKLRPLCLNLIEKKQLKPEAIKIFELSE